jgi:hypothetical protein
LYLKAALSRTGVKYYGAKNGMEAVSMVKNAGSVD